MRRWFGGSCAAPDEGFAGARVLEGDEVCALLPSQDGVVVSEDTLELARMLCAIDSARVRAARAAPPHAEPPAPEMFMDEVMLESAFSPKTTSPPSLRAILFQRATTENDDRLLQALLAHGSDEELGCTQAAINAWLERHGLGEMLLVTTAQLRRQGVPLGARTLIDDMTVACVGRHSIWVRIPEKYVRPEIDVLRYDVAALCDADNWATLRVPSLAAAAVPVVAVVMHTRVAECGVVPYMVSTFPKNIFVDECSAEMLLVCFLRWLRTCFTTTSTRLLLVSFLSNLYLLPMLRQHWPRQSTGWRLVGNALVFRHKFTAVIVDAARFACGASSREYCAAWAGRTPRAVQDMISADGVPGAILHADASIASAEAMHAAFTAQLAALRGIMPACGPDRFPCLGSMVLANAAFVGMCSENVRVHFPAHPTVAAFVRDSMLHGAAHTLRGSGTDLPGGEMYLRSVLQHVAAGMYPVGLPYFTHTCNAARLSIALCRVTRKSSVQIPFLFSKDCPSAATFDAVLTSVDINTAVRLGGYKISVVGALEWEVSRPLLRPGFQQILACASTSSSASVRQLVSWLSSSPDVIHSQVLGVGADECALLAAFAVSYCRERLHTAIAQFDNHFFSAHVLECAYNRVRVCAEFRQVAAAMVTGAAAALLTDPR
uniref:EEV maturation protein n=1 Tax=Rousettus bat poxvirus TaxID=3141933 RepID=A0AAU7E0F4_9POXV